MQDRIESAVALLFSSFDSLAKTAVLNNRSVASYNWSTQSVVEATSVGTPIRVLELSHKKDSDDSDVFEYVVRAVDYVPSNYTTMTIGGYVHSLEEQEVYPGFVLLKTKRSSA